MAGNWDVELSVATRGARQGGILAWASRLIVEVTVEGVRARVRKIHLNGSSIGSRECDKLYG